MSEHPGLFLAIYECKHTTQAKCPHFVEPVITQFTAIHPVTHLTRLKNSSPPHPLPATSLHLSITSSGSLQAPRAPATLLFTGLCIYSVRSYTDSPTLFSQLMNSIMNQISLMLVNRRINHLQSLALKFCPLFFRGGVW